MREKNSKKSPAATICSVLGAAILAAVIVICVALIVPRFFGGQFLAVVSGSMEPAIPTGSLVYVQSVHPEKVESGDVIAFYAPRDPSTVVTHRAVENHQEEQEFITKGDANKTNDMNPTRYDYFIGKILFHIPGAGFAAQAMSSLPGKLAFGSLIGLAFVLQLLGEAVEKKKKL